MKKLIADAIAGLPRGSQKLMADAVGVTPQTVNKWAKAQTAPEFDRWDAVEQFLRLPQGAIAEAAGITRLRGETAPPAQQTDDRDIVALVMGRLDQMDAGMKRLEDRVRALELSTDPPVAEFEEPARLASRAPRSTRKARQP